MSIAVQKIKRAITDMPTGGMQTGKRHIKLEYSDAQRAIAEIEGLTAERDSVQAQVEVLRSTLSSVLNYVNTMSHVDDKLSGIYDSIAEALEATPDACLAQARAEAGRAAYFSALIHYSDKTTSTEDAELADQYAERIRQEVK